MESYIDDLKEQVEELSTENKSLESQVQTLKKRKAGDVQGLAEVGNPGVSKRLRIYKASSDNADKENVDNATPKKTVRRSSCVFGIGLQ